jgi:hypothetical protein
MINSNNSNSLMRSQINDAWRVRKVASVLFLDVTGALTGVAVDQPVVHNMRMVGIPEEEYTTEWMTRRLDPCTPKQPSSLTTTKQHSLSLTKGLDPFSGICYLISTRNWEHYIFQILLDGRRDPSSILNRSCPFH